MRHPATPPFALRPHTHLLVLAGSRCHGMATPDSDVDLRGVAVPPPGVLLGWRRPWEQEDRPGCMDVFGDLLTPTEVLAGQQHGLEGTVYDLRKVLRLAADCNPNLLELLFCRDEEVRLQTAVGQQLRAAAPIFLSQRARHTFAGYARSQLARIRTHRRWLLAPPQKPPVRADFGLAERSVVAKPQRDAAQAAIQKQMDRWQLDLGDLPQSEILRIKDGVARSLAEIGAALDDTWLPAARSVGLDDNLIAVLDAERRFGAAIRQWQQYQGWLVSRNPARAALEASHGYDTKHGAHLVRLLRMGREILETGRVVVWRGQLDGDELLSIRGGAWPYDQLIAWAEAADSSLQQVVTQGRCVVPLRPDEGAIDRLCMALLRSCLV